MSLDPPWLVHRRPDSTLPTDTDEARRILRAGNLRDEIRKHGTQPVLRLGDDELSRDELRARVEAVPSLSP